ALPGLRAGDLDVALTFEYSSLPGSAYAPLHEDIELMHLLDDPMYVALPLDHPLAGKRTIRLEQLADESWSQADCGGLCGKMHVAACEAAGFEPRVGFQSDDYNVVQGLVAAGVAISLLPELALSNLRDDIVIRSLGRRGREVGPYDAVDRARERRHGDVRAQLKCVVDRAAGRIQRGEARRRRELDRTIRIDPAARDRGEPRGADDHDLLVGVVEEVDVQGAPEPHEVA